LLTKGSLGSAETERELALDSDSDGCSSNLCDVEEGYLKKKKIMKIHNLGPVLVGS
jgi:hypothetical protein